MVKKISAVLLALVLCLSVVVLPTTAAGFPEDYQIAEGKAIAFAVELDKEYYNPGDTVTISVYMYATENVELNTGNIVLAVNSSLFDTTSSGVNGDTTVRKNITANDTWLSFWKEPANTNVNWMVSQTILDRITAANTEAENGLYDSYLKIPLARNNAGSHPNASMITSAGMPGADINADPEPLAKVQLKLRDDVPQGTQVTVGMTTGSAVMTPSQFNFSGWFTGEARRRNFVASEYDVAGVQDAATVGEPAPAGPTVAKSKAELKFTLTSPTTVADPFTLRVTSVITDADWDAYFANTAVADATTDAIQRLGFVAYRGTDGFDMDTAKAVAQGTATEGYDVAWTDYIQKTSDTADAYFGARLEITGVDTRTDVTYVGVVEYLDANNQTAYAFYDAEQEALLETNYTTYVQTYINTYGSDYVA